MTNDDGRKPEGAPERSPKAGVGAPSGVDGNGLKRFSVQRKMAIMARLFGFTINRSPSRSTNSIWFCEVLGLEAAGTRSPPGQTSPDYTNPQ